MGLDIVELVMAVEEEFEIDLPDAELEHVFTVGALHELVLGKLGLSRLCQGCVTQRVFYRLRAGLQEATGLPRRAITPALALASALPLQERRGLWEHWQVASPVGLPPLQLPPPLAMVAGGGPWVVGLLLASGLGWLTWLQGVPAARAALLALPCLLVGLGVSAWLLASALQSRRVLLPAGAETLGGLSRLVASAHARPGGAGAPDGNELTSDLVWERLVAVVAKELKVDLARVTPRAHFFRDLGC